MMDSDTDRRKRSAVGVAAVVALALLLFAACASAVSSLIYDAESPPVVVWDHPTGNQSLRVKPDGLSHSTNTGAQSHGSFESLKEINRSRGEG